jgi:hypothetical protein
MAAPWGGIVLFDGLTGCAWIRPANASSNRKSLCYIACFVVSSKRHRCHYAGIRRTAGFIQTVAERIAELKAGRVDPAALAGSAGDDPRLSDIAAIYDRYQHALRARGWADRAGLGWLALEALTTRAPRVGTEWAFFAVDGFDSLSEIQIALVETLALRVDECVATATGEIDGRERGHPRLERLRRALSQRLGIPAAPLPDPASARGARPGSSHREPILGRRKPRNRRWRDRLARGA